MAAHAAFAGRSLIYCTDVALQAKGRHQYGHNFRCSVSPQSFRTFLQERGVKAMRLQRQLLPGCVCAFHPLRFLCQNMNHLLKQRCCPEFISGREIEFGVPACCDRVALVAELQHIMSHPAFPRCLWNLQLRALRMLEYLFLSRNVVAMLQKASPDIVAVSISKAPSMSPQGGQLLQGLLTALSEGEKDPWRVLLEPYSHPVLRLGACQLFPSDDCEARRIRSNELSFFFRSLFYAAAKISGCSLSRYDLHHGHVFFNRETEALGVLFHTKEYPAADETLFPYDLGYCQTGSDVVLENSGDMARRTVLWVFGDPNLVLLDSRCRLPFGTIYEGEFGLCIADLFWFESRFGNKFECLNRGLHVAPYV